MSDNHASHCAGISFEGQIQLVAFCVFEFCVGLFWPSMMKMRAAHVPEEMRATIINFFRIPLNLFVCIVLYNVRPAPPESTTSLVLQPVRGQWPSARWHNCCLITFRSRLMHITLPLYQLQSGVRCGTTPCPEPVVSCVEQRSQQAIALCLPECTAAERVMRRQRNTQTCCGSAMLIFMHHHACTRQGW